MADDADFLFLIEGRDHAQSTVKVTSPARVELRFDFCGRWLLEACPAYGFVCVAIGQCEHECRQSDDYGLHVLDYRVREKTPNEIYMEFFRNILRNYSV